MAALHYKDDHNKAAYLEKSQGSEGYHQILDFLNGSSLRMLKHKLELARDVVGNDLTTAEQLIGFIKNQLGKRLLGKDLSKIR
ncbi:hypothetical protein Tco_1481229 [Tanacetum coccineum]